MKRIAIRVEGQVQGVFFRYSAKAEADRLRLVGYAKNVSDGSVEVVAEGGEETLDALLSWCKLGPPTAEVKHVSHEFIDATREFKSFEMR